MGTSLNNKSTDGGDHARGAWWATREAMTVLYLIVWIASLGASVVAS